MCNLKGDVLKGLKILFCLVSRSPPPFATKQLYAQVRSKQKNKNVFQISHGYDAMVRKCCSVIVSKGQEARVKRSFSHFSHWHNVPQIRPQLFVFTRTAWTTLTPTSSGPAHIIYNSE